MYIIYSQSKSKYYVGETTDLNARLAIHNDIAKNTNSTKSGIPWELFWSLEVPNRTIARKIEAHVKRMKRVSYYHSLKQYPEVA